MVSHMKITIDISDELLIRARKYAAENHCTLKQVVEQQGLRRVLQQEVHHCSGDRGAVRWVTVPGKPAPDLGPADREAMYSWLTDDHDR
jgi:hypothetical protein